MRPAIKAGLVLAWRDPDTLQIGIDPRRAVALTGIAGVAELIGLLDGSRDHAQVLAAAEQRGIPRATADRVISLLAAAGALQDFPSAALRGLPDDARTRLARELACVALARGATDGGARVLARRQAARVRVHGTGPAGSAVASLLAAAGVGQVACTGPAGESPGGPGGIPPIPQPTGIQPPGNQPPGNQPARTQPPGIQLRGTAARGQPLGTGPGLPGRRPDLAVLAGEYPPELPGQLLDAGIPHLAAAASEAIGVVGPLVTPGQSACLGCLDLARADRDPAWPLILAQAIGHAAYPAACDAVLAAAVAAQAAAQVLAYLDLAVPPPAVTNGTLELVLPGWQWRRRSWRRDRRCRCSRRRETCPRM